MKNYMRELSFREILGGCFDVYFHNFFTILIIFALPVYPVMVFQSYLMLQDDFVMLGGFHNSTNNSVNYCICCNYRCPVGHLSGTQTQYYSIL